MFLFTFLLLLTFIQYNEYNIITEHVSTPVPTMGITVSLVGAATSIIFVVTNTCLHVFATKVLSRQIFVVTNIIVS